MTYRLTNTEGRTGRAWAAEYATKDEAAEALRAAMGWDEIVLSNSYAVDEGTAVSAYATQGECDADQEGAHAPRIVAADAQPTVHCACGAWTGEDCAWSGPASETVLVEYMPEQLRASHTAAGNHGVYPHNGAVRLYAERSCADALLADEDERDWARIVE